MCPMHSYSAPIWLGLRQSLLLQILSVFGCGSPGISVWVSRRYPQLVWSAPQHSSPRGVGCKWVLMSTFFLSAWSSGCKTPWDETETSLLVINHIFPLQLFSAASALSVFFSKQQCSWFDSEGTELGLKCLNNLFLSWHAQHIKMKQWPTYICT